MSILGRTMQRLGLCALPLAMFLNLVDVLSLWNMLSMTAAGFAMFWIGRILEGYGEAPNGENR
jgi:hypothetical protein